jgi:hypothetical protein
MRKKQGFLMEKKMKLNPSTDLTVFGSTPNTCWGNLELNLTGDIGSSTKAREQTGSGPCRTPQRLDGFFGHRNDPRGDSTLVPRRMGNA